MPSPKDDCFVIDFDHMDLAIVSRAFPVRIVTLRLPASKHPEASPAQPASYEFGGTYV